MRIHTRQTLHTKKVQITNVFYLSILASSICVCSIRCTTESECKAAIFNKKDFTCTLYKVAMVENEKPITLNGLDYLVLTSALYAVSQN